MKIIIKKNVAKLFYFFIFFSFIFQSEILVQDTYSYVENLYKRPFFYPFIINVFQIISENFYLNLLSVFQLILGYISVIYFSFFFIKKFQIRNIFYQIILIFSVAYPYLGISMKVGLTIFSESIGYPLVLIFSVFYIKYYIFLIGEEKKKYFFYLMFLIILMVLNKKTFLILIPLIFLGELNKLLINKKFLIFIKNIFLVIAVLVFINLVEKTNTYLKVGVFKPISVGGASLLTAPFYLASQEDLKKVEGFINKKIVQIAIEDFNKNNIENNLIDKSENDILSFAKNNRKIFSHYYSQFVYMQDFFENKIAKNEIYGIDEKNELVAKQLSSKHCSEIAIQLFKMKPKENAIFYITNVIYGMGGYFVSRDDLRGFYANVGFGGLYILILQVLVLIICLISVIKNSDYKKKNISYIILFFLILNLINCLATALFQPVYDRFTFFTFQMVFFSISLIFVLFFSKNKI